jgi:hypothetical protein
MTINEEEIIIGQASDQAQHSGALERRRETGSVSQPLGRGRTADVPGRIITIPSPELRQGVRLTVLSATNPAERARIIQLLVREMTDQVVLTGGLGGEVLSVLQLINAAADHLDRMHESRRPSLQRKPIHGTEEHRHV